MYRRLAEQYQAAGADGHDVLVLEMLPDLVGEIVSTVKGVNIDRVAVVDAGSGGQSSGNGSGIPGMISQLPAAVVAMNEQIETATGVDLLATLNRNRGTEDDNNRNTEDRSESGM